MGVNTTVLFPPGTEIRRVAQVAAALLGHSPEEGRLQGGGIYAKVPGFTFQSGCDSSPELATIILDLSTGNPVAKLIAASDGVPYHLSYHFESELGCPGIFPASTAAKIALCVGLVKFFGGTVDFNDCDIPEVDFIVPARKDVHAQSGSKWDAFQRRILAIEPLTEADIKKYEKFAAYQQ